jgi:Ubiquitin elongating factor core
VDWPGEMLRSYLSYAAADLRTMEYSTARTTATWLLPEMVERIAVMLNYFLDNITGELAARVSARVSGPSHGFRLVLLGGGHRLGIVRVSLAVQWG